MRHLISQVKEFLFHHDYNEVPFKYFKHATDITQLVFSKDHSGYNVERPRLEVGR